MRVAVKASSKADAEQRVRRMFDKLPAYPVTEDYLIEVEG